LSFKHPAEEEEAEWRIIRLSMRDGTSATAVTPHFRPRAGGLLPFIPLLEERQGDAGPPIAEVVVGPSAHPDVALNAIRQLLQVTGYDSVAEMVRQSAVPFRV
jgi:hypothetical protein